MRKPKVIGKFILFTRYIVALRTSFVFRSFFLLFLLYLLTPLGLDAQDSYAEGKAGAEAEPAFAYDDIPALVMLDGYPNFYLDVIYGNNNVLYVNVQELFYSLKISCLPLQNGEILSGFIGAESQNYLIDYNLKQIKVGTEIFKLRNEILKENGTLYMESGLFAEVFGLRLTFNYRSLTLILKSDFELPVIKQQRLENMRDNIAKLQGETVADTSVQRNYHLFKPGVIDWSAASYQTWNGPTDNRLSLGVGAELLYGEANVSVNYYDQYKFDNRQLFYLWRWVDNDKTIIKQAQLGRISNRTISFIQDPVVGGVIRNSPTTIRKAEGFYTISEFTEPDWTVELYINDILVDFTKADASGSYQFNVPLVYGYTILKLKFYGPMGEERTEERTMNVPYTVMPEHKLEYSLSAGLVQDSSSSRFGKAEFNYGVNRFLTVGGGAEYLSSISTGALIPYANFTMQPFSKLTLYGEYAHGVKARGLINYYFMKSALLEIDYTKFVEGQRATLFNAQEERKVRLSIPFRFKKISGFSKLELTENVYNVFSYYMATAMFSAYYRQFSANSATQFNWIDNREAYVTSDLSLSYRLGKGYLLRPSAKFNVSRNELMSYKVEFEKSIPKGNFSVSYERNMAYNSDFINFSFRYDLSFARTGVTASQSNGQIYTSQSAQGSLAFGSGNNHLHKSGNTAMSKGGISIYPFLDLNNNGIFDEGEHMVKLNAVRVMGGTAIFSENDSIVRIPELNAFTKYIVQFDDNDLQSISWRFKHKTYEILVDPNQFKRVDIPIVIVGEMNGMAFKQSNNSMKGIGRILINIYDKTGTQKIAETQSENDGYINFLGLEPGEYVARVDSVQLNNLGFIPDPLQLAFTIRRVEEGDIVDGLDFVLTSLHPEIPEIEETLLAETEFLFAEEITTVLDTLVYETLDTLYKVQLLALGHPIEGDDYFSKLIADVPGLMIEERLGEDGLYHYSTLMSFKGKAEARAFQRKIKASGWKDSFVAVYAGEKRADKAFVEMLAKMTKKTDQKSPPIPLLAKVVEKVVPIKAIDAPAIQQNIPTLELRKIVEPNLEESFSVVRDTLTLMPNDTLYKVHLLALRVPIRVKGYFTRLQTDIPGLSIDETFGENKLYQYSTGAIRGIGPAREFMRLIKQSGWETCFLVTYTVEESDVPIYRLKRSK